MKTDTHMGFRCVQGKDFSCQATVLGPIRSFLNTSVPMYPWSTHVAGKQWAKPLFCLSLVSSATKYETGLIGELKKILGLHEKS